MNAATAVVVLAAISHLEFGMSDAFHICWFFVFFPFFFQHRRKANQRRFRCDESTELLLKQTVNEISADAVGA